MTIFQQALANVRSQAQGDAVLPLLADPNAYRACLWDLSNHPARFTYWLGLFRSHFPKLLDEAVVEAVDRGVAQDDARAAARRAAERFNAILDELASNPKANGRLDILEICLAREAVIRDVGFPDPYRIAKHRENETALRLLPQLLEQLDTMPDPQRAIRIAEGVFAGNIFDLGATQTAALFENGKSVDFHAVRGKLAPRPWLIDGLDRWVRRIVGRASYGRALVFVDNAGCDIVLGMVPFVRDLLLRGIDVLLTANTTPSLNDITHDALVAMMNEIAEFDRVIRASLHERRLQLVASGNGLPLIDLTRVSQELVAAVYREPIDLVVLEGMGRAVESNLDAAFHCDSLKLAMVKDQGVAEALGGKVYDLVMRFDEI